MYNSVSEAHVRAGLLQRLFENVEQFDQTPARAGMSGAELTTVNPHDKVVWVQINRRALNDGASAQLVDDVTAASDADPKKPVVLDFKKVEFTPSSVLGALVRISQTFKLDGRRLVLVHVDRRVRGTLSVTRLDKILEVRETIEDAISAM